jgi:nucleoside-diphosphate kinase
MTERTLLLIKPDAVEKQIIGKIIQRIEDRGYRIVNIRMIRLSRDEAETFYEIHRGKPFFRPLIDFMISGPCVPVILERSDAITGLREMIGCTDPADAAEGTLRREFAADGRRNAVHASDSQENAAREISFFFDLKETYH